MMSTTICTSSRPTGRPRLKDNHMAVWMGYVEIMGKHSGLVLVRVHVHALKARKYMFGFRKERFAACEIFHVPNNICRQILLQFVLNNFGRRLLRVRRDSTPNEISSTEIVL